MLARFEVVARRRPVALVGTEIDPARVGAPYVAIQARVAGAALLGFAAAGVELIGTWDGQRCELAVTAAGAPPVTAAGAMVGRRSPSTRSG